MGDCTSCGDNAGWAGDDQHRTAEGAAGGTDATGAARSDGAAPGAAVGNGAAANAVVGNGAAPGAARSDGAAPGAAVGNGDATGASPEDELQRARDTIDDLDAQAAALFVARMDAVAAIGRCKRELSLPVCNPDRERIVHGRCATFIADETLRPYFAEVMNTVIDAARRYQESAHEC